jgi:hypothetical protein
VYEEFYYEVYSKSLPAKKKFQIDQQILRGRLKYIKCMMNNRRMPDMRAREKNQVGFICVTSLQ